MEMKIEGQTSWDAPDELNYPNLFVTVGTETANMYVPIYLD